MAEVSNLGGWFPAALCDGWDEAGRSISWHGYENLDGRKATVWAGGACSDPELQALLAGAHSADLLRPPSLPWWLSPMEAASALTRWLAARRPSAR